LATIDFAERSEAKSMRGETALGTIDFAERSEAKSKRVETALGTIDFAKHSEAKPMRGTKYVLPDGIHCRGLT